MYAILPSGSGVGRHPVLAPCRTDRSAVARPCLSPRLGRDHVGLVVVGLDRDAHPLAVYRANPLFGPLSLFVRPLAPHSLGAILNPTAFGLFVDCLSLSRLFSEVLSDVLAYHRYRCFYALFG